MPRLACKVDLEPHMPLKLKGILMDYGVEQRAYAAAITQTGGYVTGKPLSLTAAAAIMNNNVWPSFTPKQLIVSQTEEFLRALGVPETELETMLARLQGHEEAAPVAAAGGLRLV